MSEEDVEARRWGDKSLPFKECDECGVENVMLHVIRNRALCPECSKHE